MKKIIGLTLTAMILSACGQPTQEDIDKQKKEVETAQNKLFEYNKKNQYALMRIDIQSKHHALFDAKRDIQLQPYKGERYLFKFGRNTRVKDGVDISGMYVEVDKKTYDYYEAGDKFIGIVRNSYADSNGDFVPPRLDSIISDSEDEAIYADKQKDVEAQTKQLKKSIEHAEKKLGDVSEK